MVVVVVAAVVVVVVVFAVVVVAVVVAVAARMKQDKTLYKPLKLHKTLEDTEVKAPEVPVEEAP